MISFNGLMYFSAIIFTCCFFPISRFVVRLLAWALSHVVGISIGLRIGGLTSLRNVVVKLNKVHVCVCKAGNVFFPFIWIGKAGNFLILLEL